MMDFYEKLQYLQKLWLSPSIECNFVLTLLLLLFFFLTIFIPTTTQQLDSKLHNYTASLLHVLAFVGYLQGDIVTEQNMDNIKFRCQTGKNCLQVEMHKGKNYLAALNMDNITFSLQCYSLKNDDLR